MVFGHVSFVSPGGRFCGSLRQSGAPSELPQIFQVAVDLRSWSLNQAFWVAPRIVCGGASFRGFGTCAPLNEISFGGLPPLKARPPSRICAASSGNMLGEFWTEAGDSLVAEGIGTAVTMLIGDDEIEMPTVAVSSDSRSGC